MDIFDAYEMDDEAVSDGIWADLIVRGDKIGRIRCRSSDPDINTEYRKALNVAGLSIAAMEHAGKKPAELESARTELTCGILADCILTDWELYQKKGDQEVKIKFTQKKARELLLKLPKLRAAVEVTASGWTKFRRGKIEETVKI